ncbi:type II secretion system F family protein [Thermoanaerobacter pentosaceus]|uniref:Tight adherence protein B n=1 Tax=Thermoanaerobacter pentosaceus TaxID=694059 RepID=A0ABT9M340_9THEO|nr:type II secretion system F family protein [Thermoanaerobacter pentosaceus]MDP9750340.1 tight adherence protein B [Thermoanaerobacter pentosaceus]
MILFLIFIASFLFFVTLIALHEYRLYQIQVRLNRQLLKQPDVKFNLFSFIGRLYNRLEVMLKEAGIGIDTDDFILYFLYLSVIIIAVGSIFDRLIYSFIVIAFLIFAVKITAEMMKERRKFEMEKSFGNFASEISVLLKANPNLGSTIEELSHSISDKLLKEEINAVVNDINTGLSVESALKNFKDRNSFSKVISSWVDSIIFANMTGASLTAVSEETADRINKKIIRMKSIKQKTARLKMVALSTLGLMIITFGIMGSSMPGFKESFELPVGRIILFITAVVVIATTYYIFNSINRLSTL